MNKQKKLIILEICYDSIAKIHSDLCNDNELCRKSDITDDAMDIMRRIIKLSMRIEKECADE